MSIKSWGFPAADPCPLGPGLGEPRPVPVHCLSGRREKPTCLTFRAWQAQLGFGDIFVTPPEAIARIDQIVEDLFARTGDGWDRALAKWGDERAEKLWCMGASAGLRLRGILRKLSSTSTLLFADTKPMVSWPVGVPVVGSFGRAGSSGGADLREGLRRVESAAHLIGERDAA